MNNVIITNNLDNFAGDTSEPLDFNDLYNTFKINWQVNNTYEISFTATYTEQYKDAWNMLKMKRWLELEGQFYVIQQLTNGFDEYGLPTMQITANALIIDLMKNIRIDPKQPTEDNPDMGDSGSGSNRLDQFFQNNDQGIKYELHGNFPQLAVDCSGSLYEWLGQNLATFGAYYIPDNYVLKIYDLPNLRHQTDRVFYYESNTDKVTIQMDGNDMVNECDVYGGKMEKDITTGDDGEGGGNLDNVEGFCKSPINAGFGCNKQVMISSFAAKSGRLRYLGADANKLYDTVKNAGVSPEWFFAYELQEGLNTNYGWLNHTYPHGDAYQDAVSVCNWIKQTSQSNTLTPAWWAPEGSMTPNPTLAAKWSKEFGKGTIGRVYLQGTAAATWDLAGVTPNPAIGKPITGCVNTIRSWGGHTVQASASSGGSWGWPFPCGEGSFMQVQKFGYDGGYRQNSFHDGLDFGSIDHPGSEVHAVHGGKVTISRDWVAGVNYYVVIQDSTGLNVEYQEAFSSPSDIYVNVGDTVQTGQVIGRRTTDHLHIGITRHSFREAFSHAFSNDGTWLDPQSMIKSGGSIAPSSNTDTTQTVSESYYALYFHYKDEDSIKKYGIHRGPQIVMDSIYDMNTLKQYVDATVQHVPPTTLSNNIVDQEDEEFSLGDVMRLVVPENGMNTEVVLMGFNYNPYNPTAGSELTWNNTGLTMKDSIYAMYQDINQINRNVAQINYYGGTGAMSENHFANIPQNKGDEPKYSKKQIEQMMNYRGSDASGK